MKISTLIHFPSYIRRLPGWPVVGICIAVGLSSTRGAHPKNFGKRFFEKSCGRLRPRYVAVNRETFLPHQQQDGKVPFETVAEFCCGTRATLERSDLKSENIVLRVELRMPRWLTGDSIKTLVIHFRLFPLFLKPIKIELETELLESPVPSSLRSKERRLGERDCGNSVLPNNAWALNSQPRFQGLSYSSPHLPAPRLHNSQKDDGL